MKFTGRFIFAFILAIAATVLNYVWMVSKAPSEGYVVVRQDIVQGEVIKQEMLREIKLPLRWSDTGTGAKIYTETFLPWKARRALVGLKAVRSFQKGEMVQQSDVAAIDILPDYDILGPFRLLAVGGRFANAGEDEERGDTSSAITIAIPYSDSDPEKIDVKTRRLVQIVENERTRRTNDDSRTDLRLVGIVAWTDTTPKPPQSVPTVSPPKRTLGLADGELALVVPLPNLDTIPEVLLREDSPQIGFLVPATVVRSLGRSGVELDLEEFEDE